MAADGKAYQRCSTKRGAAREARHVVAMLIESYFEVGQPNTGCAELNHPDDDACELCENLVRELRHMRDRLFERSRIVVPTRTSRVPDAASDSARGDGEKDEGQR